MKRTEEAWMGFFASIDALWIHDGNPRRPHALLTSGNHSDGYFNGSFIIQRPAILSQACSDLILNCEKEYDFQLISRVVGSAMGAVTMAYEVACQLESATAFTEPTPDEREMILKRFEIKEGEFVLVVEDVITTGGTTLKTISSLEKAGAQILPVILVIFNRSGKKKLEGRRIVALIDRALSVWPPEDCPLCGMGSEPVRPKANWQELTAQY